MVVQRMTPEKNTSAPHGLPPRRTLHQPIALRPRHRLALLRRPPLGVRRHRARATRRARRAQNAGRVHDTRRTEGRPGCESAAGIAGVLNIATALPQFAASVRDLDADPYLFNVATGTLDLRTSGTRPQAPADRLTKVARGAYHPDTTSTPWQAFLARVLPDADVRAFLRRYVGVGLLGAVREHKLVIGTGVGANGKSVFDGAIRNALGDYAITAEPDLRGVRWVAASESERDRRLAERP